MHRADGRTGSVGNIVMGYRTRLAPEADLAGLTFPLVTKKDGGKFGKS
jgi:tyrosyl-tRNA synthetase